MEYESCAGCSHCKKLYRIGGGLTLLCEITGDELEITECPES